MPGQQAPGLEANSTSDGVKLDTEEQQHHSPSSPHCDSGCSKQTGDSNTRANSPKAQNRKRFCRSCPFSCRDAAEFTHHQACHSLENGDRSSVGSELVKDQRPGRFKLRSRTRGQALLDQATKEGEFQRVTTMGDTEGVDLTASAMLKQRKEEISEACLEGRGQDSENRTETMQNGHDKLNGMRGDESEEEDRDEPDAMSSTAKDENLVNDFSSPAGGDISSRSGLYNGVDGSHSGDEDMDDEGRLVIDDENMQRRLLRKRKLVNGHSNGSAILTDQDAHRNTPSGVNSGVNLSNNFLGVTAESLNNNESRTETHSNFGMENEEDEEEEVPDLMPNDGAELMIADRSLPLGLATNDMDSLDRAYEEDKRKKKKTRQEVDPGKYFEAVDSAGTKYACSQCGNIYKWRKSLNKHWKEKHSQDPLVDSPSPPGMLELLKSGKYTQLGSRRIYDNNFLATIKTQKDEGGSNSAPTPSSSNFHHPASTPTASSNSATNGTAYAQQMAGSASPTNFLTLKQVQASASRFAASVASFMPNSIGRFAGQPVFPNMMFPLPHHFQQQQQQAAAAAAAAAAVVAQQQNGFNSQEEGALDLTRDSKPPSRRSSPCLASPQPGPSNGRSYSPEPDDQDQPLDFSKKTSSEEKPSASARKETDKERSENQSDAELANHQATHLNKRIVRCNECYLQLKSMEDLNSHFMRAHSRKLNDHKEAIKKIPHGLQQTYHLLNMDLRDIGELGNQDLGAAEARSLKCNKCDFEAKWPAELQKHAVSHSEERPYVCMVCGSTYKWKWDLVKHFQKSHPNLPNPYRRNDKRDSPDCSSEEDAEDPELKRARLLMMGIMPGPSRRNAEGSNRVSPNNLENDAGTSAEAAVAGARGVASARGVGRPGTGQGAGPSGADDGISVEGIIAATQAGQRVVSSQPNILDDEPVSSMERSMAFLRSLPFPGTDPASVNHTSHAAHFAHVVQAAHVAQMAQAAQEMIDRRNRAQRAVQDTMRQRQNGTMSFTSGNSSNTSSNASNVAKKVVKESGSVSSKTEELPYKCTMCNYHARWPSEVTQHMKNHSDSKPYLCPRCDYRSKWKWDVVKHLKRCGGGGINDVIDTTKMRKKEGNTSSPSVSANNGPPNAVVSQLGRVKKTTPQPAPGPAIILPSVDADGIQGATVVRQPQQLPQNFLSPILPAPAEGSSTSSTIDLTTNTNRLAANNNNDSSTLDNNINNNYSAYANGQPNFLQQQQQALAVALTTGAFVTPPKNNTSSTTNSSSTTTSPSASSTPAFATNNSSTRHSSEMWTCPHCPFSTASQAELKRHSGLHSEDKPFKCDVCQYSTRWACDLKKHRKSYNHFPGNRPLPTTANTPPSANITSALCTPVGSQEKPGAAVESDDIGPSPGRFKCYQCTLYFQTMQKLIDHRTNEHIGLESAHSSPAPGSQQASADQQGEEIDAARIKHPRKAIKQIQCPKCEFVCKSRQTMEKHMADHEELENSGFNCFYCSAQFRDKDCLLDHLTTHTAFNPGEWETFFMTSEEEDQQLRAAAKAEAKVTAAAAAIESEGKLTSENDADENKQQSETMAPLPVPVSSISSTEERIQKILSEVPKQMSSSTQQKQSQQENKYRCEWCPAQFSSLTAVFKHANQAHPIQLKEQETGMAAPPVSPLASSTPKSKNNLATVASQPQQPLLSPKKIYTGEPLEILKQQIAEKRNHHIAEKYSDIMQARLASAAGMQVPHILLQPPHINTSVKEEESEEGEVPQYNCDKCNFSTPSKTTFLRHSELHGGAMPSKCWFCDYSVEHMQLLYQHMKISHTRKWKALSQDPKYAEAVYRMTMLFGNTPQGSNNNDSPPLQDVKTNQMLSPNKLPMPLGFGSYAANTPADDGGVMDLSSRKSKPLEDANSVVSNSDITYRQRVQYTWNGIPINVSTSGVTVQFKCPHCPMKDESVAKACCHVATSHQPLARFRCRACRHTENNVQTLVEHCKTAHPPQERTIDVLEVKALQVNETDMAQFNILRAKFFQDLVLANAHSAMSANIDRASAAVSSKLLTCPFCPFKTQSSQDMKLHVPNHSRLARYRCQFCDFSTDVPDIISNHIRVHDPSYTGETSHSNHKTETVDPLSVPAEKAVKVEQKDSNEDSNEKEGKQIQPVDSPFKQYRVNGGRMRYRCSACPYRTTCKSNIIKHKRQHQHNKRYKCTKCSYSAARAVLLKNHMDAHDTPVSDGEGQHNDIFCDPHSPGDDLKSDENEDNEETEMEIDDLDDDDACSDDLNEMDAKAIADLEAKDIMEAEAAHKVSSTPDIGEDSADIDERLQDDLDSPAFVQLKTGQHKTVTNNRESHNDVSNNNKSTIDTRVGGHGLKKRFICDFCDWSADNTDPLLQHRKEHEAEPGYEANVDDPESVFLNAEFEEGTLGEFEARIMDAPMKEGEAKLSSAALSPPFKLTVIKKSYPCKACPFKTNSKSSFTAHKAMHGSGDEYSCQYCTFQAKNKGVLQQHAFLHPADASHATSDGSCNASSTEVIKNEKDNKSSASELSEAKGRSIKVETTISSHRSEDADKELASPVLNNNCEKSRESLAIAEPTVAAVKPTRVYVCQYCEREFEAKNLMIQHEKQHLVGSQ